MINGYKIKPMADLQGAYLREADLQMADLQTADLRWANLWRADLRWAKLQGTGFSFMPNLDGYFVSACKGLIRIGCQEYAIEEWQNFSDARIAKMAYKALDWWKKNKRVVFDLHERAKGV